MDLVIPKGEQWAGPTWKRLWYNVPPITFRTSFTWECSVDFGSCPKGTSIKLCGTSEFKPFNCVPENPLHTTHNDSDRFVALWDGSKVSIGAYGYRKCQGGVTGTGKYLDYFCKVDNGERFTVRTNIQKDRTLYRIDKCKRAIEYERDGRGLFRFFSFAHAAGNHGPVAPSDIHISLKRL